MDKNVVLVLIIASIAFVALSGCIQRPVCGNGICETGESPENCPQDCGQVPACIPEGKTGASGVDKCCTGLKEVNNCTGDGQVCGCGPGFVCTYCGDGACGLGENACNCLQDCPAAEFDEIAVGNNTLRYTDSARIEREVPFYIKLDNTSSESTFTVDDQRFYYLCESNNTTIGVEDNDYLNGYLIEIDSNAGANFIETDKGPVRIAAGNTVYLGGAHFVIHSFDGAKVNLNMDGNCQFSRQSFSNPSYLDMGGVSILNNAVYYDDDDPKRGPLTIPLNITNVTMQDTYNYLLFVDKSGSSDGDIWLVLQAQTLKTDKGSSITFYGTDTDEEPDVSGYEAAYYLPDIVSFGTEPGDYAYFIAVFFIQQGKDFVTPIIDTATGNTANFPNDQLAFYSGCVYYPGEGDVLAYIKCYGGDDSATTAYGSEISVSNGIATMQMAVAPTPSGPGGGSSTPTIVWE